MVCTFWTVMNARKCYLEKNLKLKVLSITLKNAHFVSEVYKKNSKRLVFFRKLVKTVKKYRHQLFLLFTYISVEVVQVEQFLTNCIKYIASWNIYAECNVGVQQALHYPINKDNCHASAKHLHYVFFHVLYHQVSIKAEMYSQRYF